MRTKSLLACGVLLFTCAACFAQSPYLGLTPGKSTRAEVERVFGRPVQSVSKTLIEYKSPDNVGKIYVQYRDESTAAILDRIEITCAPTSGDSDPCWKRNLSIWDRYLVHEGMGDASKFVYSETSSSKAIEYFGPSRYMVYTRTLAHEVHSDEVRWAFYSKELYEAVAPKLVGCTGTILGDWETNRGRMRIERVGDLRRDDSGVSLVAPVKGTYSNGNGTLTGYIFSFGIQGEWKDDTGTGKMTIMHSYRAKTISGDWERKTGSGPAKGTWEGRCVETK